MDRSARIARIEQAACRNTVEACAPHLRAALGLSAHSAGPALVLRARSIAHPLHNRALAVAAPEPLAQELVDSVLASFRAQDIERYLIQVPAEASGDAVRRCLSAAGLRRYHRNWHQLSRGRGPVPSIPVHGLRIEQTGPKRAHLVADILGRAFDLPEAGDVLYAAVVGRPRWWAFLASIDGAPAGAGLLFIDGATAYLAGGATRPEYRGRGVQGALMAHRVALALELGCDLVASITGEAVLGEPNSSYNNMLRCGLSLTSITENWTLPDAPRFSHTASRSNAS